MRDLDRVARSCSLEETGGAGRIDHNEGRPLVSKGESKMPRDGSRDAADAGLHEHMGRRRGKPAQGFAHHGGVALHDQARNALVAGP